MKTEILKIDDSTQSLEEALFPAAEIIRGGGTVVFPTETVYGLGGDATNPASAEKIYAAKGRPADNPLIIHLAEPIEAEKYAVTCELYYRLAERFMPGPLTVILPAKQTIPERTRAGLSTVAVRIPKSPIARTLIRLSGVPIAAPSANLSGSPSPTTAQHVTDDMLGRVDMIIDGPDAEFGLESTIVKIEDSSALTLLRPGAVTVDDLLNVTKNVNIASAVTEKLGEGERPLSPGMKYRHYAPRASVVLLDGDASGAAQYIKSQAKKNIAIIAYDEDVSAYRREFFGAVIYSFGAKCDTLTQANRLFYILREADKQNFDEIYAPLPEKEGIGLALYNRMIRAAAYKTVKV